MSAVDRSNLDLVLPQIAAQHIFVRPAEHKHGARSRGVLEVPMTAVDRACLDLILLLVDAQHAFERPASTVLLYKAQGLEGAQKRERGLRVEQCAADSRCAKQSSAAY